VEHTFLHRISVSLPPGSHTPSCAKVALYILSWVIADHIVLVSEEVGINRSGSLKSKNLSFCQNKLPAHSLSTLSPEDGKRFRSP
jgi:hypothetical protein